MKQNLRLALLVLAALQTFASMTVLLAAPGDLDWSASTSVGVVWDVADSVAIQPDGRIVSCGSSDGMMSLTRHNPDGSLDTSFGGDGKVTIEPGSPLTTDSANAVAIQTDGKIVIAGYYWDNGERMFVVARLNPDGILDTSFDGDGKVTTAFEGYFESSAWDVVIQPDGKIIAAGGVVSQTNSKFALARYNTNGSLDTSFDADGKVISDFGGLYAGASAIAVQADGKIIAAGASQNTENRRFALVRFNIDGSADTTFGVAGKVTTTISDDSYVKDIAVQEDGRIVAVGGSSALFESWALVRYSHDGSLDPTFGQNGIVLNSFVALSDDARANAVAIQANGKIVAAGIGGQSDFCYDEVLSSIIRYNGDGHVDSSFGTGGIVTTLFFEDGGFCTSFPVQDVAIQSGGQIVVAGQRSAVQTGETDFMLAQYLGGSGSGPTHTPTSTPVPTPTPDPTLCTPSLTVTEVLPGSLNAFTSISAGQNSVTVDIADGGLGLQGFTVISAANANVTIPAFPPGTSSPVTAIFTIPNPAQAVDFTVRASARSVAVLIRAQCAASPTPTPSSTPMPSPSPSPTATTPTPVPTPPVPGVCSPTLTITEIFPGSSTGFESIAAGLGSVTIDTVNTGPGIQGLTVVNAVNASVTIPPFAKGTTDPVTAMFVVLDPSQPVDFTLRASARASAVLVRGQCGGSTNAGIHARLFWMSP